MIRSYLSYTRILTMLSAVGLFVSTANVFGQITDSGTYTPAGYFNFQPPPAGESYTDPIFGASITRVSSALETIDSTNGQSFLPRVSTYSTATAFNHDNSRILALAGTYFQLYDGSGHYIEDLWRYGLDGLSEPRWSRSNGDILYFHTGNQLKSFNISTKALTLLHTFNEYATIGAKGKSDLSEDGDHLILAGDGRYVFVYTISTDTKSANTFDTAGKDWDGLYVTPDNHCLISWNSGNGSGGSYSGVEMFDMNMNFLRQVSDAGGEMVVTRDVNGEEVLVESKSADANPASNCMNGIVKIRLADVSQTCLLQLDWSLSVNISAMADGWVFLDTYARTDPSPMSAAWVPYTNELLQIKLDGTEVRRLAHHRSRPFNGNDSTPRASASRDGRRVVFTSNFGLQALLGVPPDYTDIYLMRIPSPLTSLTSKSVSGATSTSMLMSTAAVINAASCSQVDVQAAVNAAATGDTVLIPAGDCTWTTQVAITKGITLQGAGVGSTIIRDNVAADNLLNWDCQMNAAHRLTGIEFRDGGRPTINFRGIVSISCTNLGTTTVRVDHNKFDHLNGVSLRPDTIVGVIDHNTFITTQSRMAIYIYDEHWNGVGIFGDSSWHENVTWGSKDFLFVEDNTLTQDSCTDGFRGTRVVFRFNSLLNCHFTVHGTESPQRNRGSRAIEIYKNTQVNAGGTEDVVANIRSGSALVWGNTATGLVGGGRTARMNQDRTISPFTFGAADGRNIWDINDPANPFASFTAVSVGPLTVTVPGAAWTANQWKGFIIRKTSACTGNCSSVILSNTSDTITIKSADGVGSGDLNFTVGETFEINRLIQALDGVGRSGGSLLSRNPPVKPASWNDQVTFPLYEWLNTSDGKDIDFAPHPNCVPCNENEHYYNYKPAVPFDGSSGVGVGLAANKPVTCTPGVWYWATDEGEWWAANAGPDGRAYQCTAPNRWTAAYTPYTYPHPLTQTGPAATSTALNVSAATASYGVPQTFTATVTSGGNPVTGGTVTFTDTTTATMLASNVSLNAAGQAVTGAIVLPAMAHHINATYNPDVSHAGSFNATAVTVNKVPLLVTAVNKSITYRLTPPTFTATITGLVNGDTLAVVSGVPAFSSNATTTNGVPNAGTWTITPALGTLTAANYTFTFSNGTFTVRKAPLTVQGDDRIITYPVPSPAFTATITGFVNGDTSAVVGGSPAFSTNATTTNGVPNAGTWAITPALGTLVAANYNFTVFNSGTLTVNKAALTLTAINKSITYRPALPTYTATITGFVNGDTSAVVSGSPAFSTNATTTNGAPNAGSWTITPALGTLAVTNYSFTVFNKGILTVRKAPLTVTADDKTITYPAPFPAFTATITGFVNGDTLAAVGGAPVLSTNATMTNGVPDAGSWTITPGLGTLAASNYSFTTFNIGTLTVKTGP